MKEWLFDEEGLPWTARIRWGVALFWVASLFFLVAPLVGVYVGLWLRSKRRTATPLILYVLLTAVFAATLFCPFPGRGGSGRLGLLLNLCSLVLWLVSALTLRREVRRYYQEQEGAPLALNPALCALFGPWYISGNLRTAFPRADGGVRSGVLRLDR